MKLDILVMVALIMFGATAGAAEESADKGAQLATDIWKASGGENWAKVKEVDFTFVVEQRGKTLFSAQHFWNVTDWSDKVRWKDKQDKEHLVTVNLKAPPSDVEGKAAYGRWVNDSYWLLAPLKIRDPGVKVEAGEVRDFKGVKCDTVRLKFDSVGLTPTDEYVYYIDPKTKLPLAWDYIPNSDSGMTATWEKYESFGGLNLATEHNFKDKTIKLVGIKVVTKK